MKRFVFLLVILFAFAVSGCGPGSSPTPQPTATAIPPPTSTATATPLPTSTATATPTAAPTPTTTPTPEMLAGGPIPSPYIGWATFAYNFTVDSEGLWGSGETSFLFFFEMSSDPTKPIVFTVEEVGTQNITMLGGVGGASTCVMDHTYTVNYFLDGDFYSEDCRFEFTLDAELANTQVHNTCPLPLSDHTIFFMPAPVGPHTISAPLQPLVVWTDPRVKHVFTISDVSIPGVTECE